MFVLLTVCFLSAGKSSAGVKVSALEEHRRHERDRKTERQRVTEERGGGLEVKAMKRERGRKGNLIC
jgi:hypothetical protein